MEDKYLGSHVVTIATLILALLVLLYQYRCLAPATHTLQHRSSQATEPLLPKPNSDNGERQPEHEQGIYPTRSKALDAFRGFTLCLMMFVNYGGGGFAAFTHSVWDGLTFADLVFPWFAWILGFSVLLSSSSLRRRELPTQQVLSIGQRAVKLFLLGLFLNNGDSWSDWRIPGVLQALSVAYLVVATADRVLPWPRHGIEQRATLSFVVSHIMLGVLPLIFWNLLLTFWLRVPGCPTGYVGPGGNADGGAYRNCTGGAHLYADTVVFGIRHLFQTPTCQQQYQTGPYDPEGLINWLMVAATAYLGFLSAAIFTRRHQVPGNQRLMECKYHSRHLLVSGSCLISLGVLCGGLWVFPSGPWIPINKNLWSLSYVLLSSGLAAILLAVFTELSDNRASWSGDPLMSVGKNSIMIYVMHEICQHYAPFSPKPMTVGEKVPLLEVLLYNVVGVLWWVVVARWMDLRRIFVRL